MKPNTEKLRIKYMDNPPEGMTSEDIRRMSWATFHPFTFKIVQAIFEDFIKIKKNERYYLHRP